jgi:DNA-binding transcriptional MerR regulator
MILSDDLISFSSFSVEPVYNVKAVCVRTGITAATLRAWERRYGLPNPTRSDQGYRLYSEQDVAILGWLKRKTDSGINIAHAVAQLQTLLLSGADPKLPLPSVVPQPNRFAIRSPIVLQAEIVSALQSLDERNFDRLMNEALAIYTIETALVLILQSAIQEIRTLKKAGKISTTTEHLAISYAHQRLLHMAQTLPNVRGNNPSVVTAGFGNEHNEFDLMVIGLLLRRQGIPVTLLGTDLEPRMLNETVSHLNAGLICFHTDEPKNVARLIGLSSPQNAAGDPVLVVCCGLALEVAPELTPHIDVKYLGSDLREVTRQIIAYIADLNPPPER